VVEGTLVQPSTPQIADVPAQAPNAPVAPVAPAAPATGASGEQPVAGKIIINGREVSVDGREVSVDGSPGADATTGTEFPFPRDIPPNVYEIAKTGIIGLTLVIIAFPVFGFAKALVNRRAAAPALPSRDTTDRLQRIEAAVESMAVEVERISEGQRFVTKVLAERTTSSQP